MTMKLLVKKLNMQRKNAYFESKREQQERDEKRKILAEEKRRREKRDASFREIEELSMATNEWTTRSAEVMTNYALLSNSEKMNLLQDAKRTTAWKTSKIWRICICLIPPYALIQVFFLL